jgi:hypothetical protein
MLTLLGSHRRLCDRLTRRETLKAGALSLLGGAFNLPSLLALEESGLDRYRVVAFAKLGRHRIVKYRLEGQRRAATLNARWEHGERGWRVGAVDLVKVEQSQPA